MAKMASYTKRELHNTLQHHQKISELRLQATCAENFVPFMAVLESQWLISKANGKGQILTPPPVAPKPLNGL